VACRAFEALAEKRRTNSCRSEIRSLALAFAVSTLRAGLRRGQHEVVVVARIDFQLLVIQVRDMRATWLRKWRSWLMMTMVAL